MVRAVKLETSASGTYYNPSIGAFLNQTASGNSTNNGTGGGGTSTNATIWVDDALPAGAVGSADGGDSWNWVSSNPAPVSGATANQSSTAAGLHQHYFTSASQTLVMNTGDVLYAYVYIDPANVPSEIMLQWNDGNWGHRAYWGADKIDYGLAVPSRAYMGVLPTAGQWARLQVPAAVVALEGRTLSGMAFSLFDGRATWDNAGKTFGLVTDTNTTKIGTNTIYVTNSTVWVDDSLPAGAAAGADGGDLWNWVSSNPAPVSGTTASQSSIGPGLHQHYFTSATQKLTVNPGDTLYAYVYLDPANLPSEIMLQWSDGSWEHRAYWGANNISYGVTGTASRTNAGPLPAAGQWVRLEVRAAQVGLEGSTLDGMAFSVYDGRATWDNAGKFAIVATNSASTENPSLSIMKQGANLVVSWPATFTNFTLESSSGLGASANWVAVPGLPMVVAGRYTVTNAVGTGNRFFRLRK